MKFVQLIFLLSCLTAGHLHAEENIVMQGQTLTLQSTTINLTKDWLEGNQYPDNDSVQTWNLQDSTSGGGCGTLCSTLVRNNLKAIQVRGEGIFTPKEEQTVTVNGISIKIKTRFRQLKFFGVLNLLNAINQNIQMGSGYFPDGSGYADGSTTYTYELYTGTSYGYVTYCLSGNGCQFTWRTGISSGYADLWIELPDKLGLSSFTIPRTTIAEFKTTLYSQTAAYGKIDGTYIMNNTIEIPAITVNIPERCYTTLSGNTITFKSDIDASTVTTTGGKSVDSKQITLTATCNAKLLSKNVYASVKLVQKNGVDDGYKFKLNPAKNDYGLNRYLSVVAKHIASGSAGANTCDKDNNTMEDNKFYEFGHVAFPQSNGTTNDPYHITFNLCAFRPEGTSELLPPGGYTGAVRLVTRFFAQ